MPPSASCWVPSGFGRLWLRWTRRPSLRRRVAVEGDRKAIQHLEGGIIQDILVKEAEHVEGGQILFRMDPTKARTTAETVRKQLYAANGA